MAGCATAAPGARGAEAPSSVDAGIDAETSVVDPEAAATADAWLEEAVLPRGAVRSESVPRATVPFSSSYYSWPCSPMETRTGYWTIDDADVIDTANWLTAHPTADLIVPVPGTLSPDPKVDSALVGNVPEHDALEGIAYTVSRTDDGVAIRAEIGVFTKDTVCPTLPPGHTWGGPGQG